MKTEVILATLASAAVVCGALIQIIKIIVQHATDMEFDKVARRVSRIERRIAILEIKVSGDSDTFNLEDS